MLDTNKPKKQSRQRDNGESSWVGIEQDFATHLLFVVHGQKAFWRKDGRDGGGPKNKIQIDLRADGKYRQQARRLSHQPGRKTRRASRERKPEILEANEVLATRLAPQNNKNNTPPFHLPFVYTPTDPRTHAHAPTHARHTTPHTCGSQSIYRPLPRPAAVFSRAPVCTYLSLLPRHLNPTRLHAHGQRNIESTTPDVTLF